MPRILHVHFKAKNNVGDAAVVAAVRELTEDALGKVKWTSMLMRGLRAEPTARLLRFIDSHDLVIIGGGGFCSGFALPLNDRLIAAIRTPIVLFGIGYNRNFGDQGLDAEQRRSLALLAAKAVLCGVRDRLTAQLLGEVGGQATLTGDPALFLRPRRPWRVPPRRTPAVGFNIACHGWSLQAQHFARILGVYREVIARLVAERDPQLFYMVHTNREADTARTLRREFPGLRVCRYPAAKLLYMYGRLDLAVSMMLHSSILAHAAGTPVVNIAYDEKNRAFLEDIGHAQRSIAVADADAGTVMTACNGILDAAAPRASEDCRGVYAAAMQEFSGRLAAIVRP